MTKDHFINIPPLSAGALTVGLVRQCQTIHGRDRTCIPPRLPPEWVTTLFFIIMGIISLTVTCGLLVASHWRREATKYARWIAFTGSKWTSWWLSQNSRIKRVFFSRRVVSISPLEKRKKRRFKNENEAQWGSACQDTRGCDVKHMTWKCSCVPAHGFARPWVFLQAWRLLLLPEADLLSNAAHLLLSGWLMCHGVSSRGFFPSLPWTLTLMFKHDFFLDALPALDNNSASISCTVAEAGFVRLCGRVESDWSVR